MPKPSGIKITYAIQELAKWFQKEMDGRYSVAYHAHGSGSDFWLVFGISNDEKLMFKKFTSYVKMRTWMEQEIRRRRILFRRF